MAVTEIIDLDVVLSPSKRVKIAGKVYTLPGDVPTGLFLRIQEAAKTLDTDGALQPLADELLELFRVYDKTIKEVPGALVQLVSLITRVYSAAGENPTTPTRGATGSSSRRSK